MEVHAGAGLADGDLRGEGHLDAVGVGDLAHHPLGQHHLIGRTGDVGGQELDLLLDDLAAVGDEVADLGVGVLDLAPHAREVVEGLGAHLRPLRERGRLVVAALLLDLEELVDRREQVVLELAERLQAAAGLGLERLLRLAQDLLRGADQRVALDVVEAAHDVQGGKRGEGVEEGGAQLRDHVQVGAGGVDDVEQGGPVDPLPHGEDPVQVGDGLDGEVQLLEPAVPAHVAQVEHGNAPFGDEADDVRAGELVSGLAQGLDQGVRVEGDGVGGEQGGSSSVN